MTTLFLILLALAFYHFIYEGIIAPSLRFDLRFRMFALRDELRAAKLRHPQQIDGEVFHYLQRSINNTLRHMGFISLKLIFSARYLNERDQEIIEKLERVHKKIDECPVGVVKELRDKHRWLIGYAFLVNSGGWAIYLFPVILGAVFFSSILTLSWKILSLPEREIERIAPPETAMWASTT